MEGAVDFRLRDELAVRRKDKGWSGAGEELGLDEARASALVRCDHWGVGSFTTRGDGEVAATTDSGEEIRGVDLVRGWGRTNWLWTELGEMKGQRWRKTFLSSVMKNSKSFVWGGFLQGVVTAREESLKCWPPEGDVIGKRTTMRQDCQTVIPNDLLKSDHNFRENSDFVKTGPDIRRRMGEKGRKASTISV
ncbi:hypothetical protein K438DRAFT_1773746 [Mycena galopus ATCC 62051]|nr:hypothetical protein K438DRAFT_1773746 [Mycena galopus ATCC 62051]